MTLSYKKDSSGAGRPDGSAGKILPLEPDKFDHKIHIKLGGENQLHRAVPQPYTCAVAPMCAPPHRTNKQ